MTKDTALSLIRQYCTLLRTQRADIGECGQLLTDATFFELDTRWPQEGSEAKAMRWLGFIQGALYACGMYTLEQLKEHSRTGQL